MKLRLKFVQRGNTCAKECGYISYSHRGIKLVFVPKTFISETFMKKTFVEIVNILNQSLYLELPKKSTGEFTRISKSPVLQKETKIEIDDLFNKMMEEYPLVKEHIEKRRIINRKYIQDWKKNNPDKVKKSQKKYRQKHIEKIKKYQRDYYYKMKGEKNGI